MSYFDMSDRDIRALDREMLARSEFWRGYREAVGEMRARVYSSTLILPDGERVVPQTTLLKILRAVEGVEHALSGRDEEANQG